MCRYQCSLERVGRDRSGMLAGDSTGHMEQLSTFTERNAICNQHTKFALGDVNLCHAASFWSFLHVFFGNHLAINDKPLTLPRSALDNVRERRACFRKTSREFVLINLSLREIEDASWRGRAVGPGEAEISRPSPAATASDPPRARVLRFLKHALNRESLNAAMIRKLSFSTT